MALRNINTYRPLADDLRGEVAEQGWAKRALDIDPSNLEEVRQCVGAVATLLSFKNIREPEIADICVASSEKRLSAIMSNVGMDFHSDNVYLEHPCTNVLLYCIQEAKEGGETLLVDARKVINDIDPSVALELAKPKWVWSNHYSQGRGLCPPHAVVGMDGSIRWWRGPLANTDAADLAVADDFNNALNDPGVIERFTLKHGELISIDNTRVLHSRTKFTGEDRFLIRGRSW